MPRGIHKDAAHLHDILEKGVILDKDRVEGSLDSLDDDDTVYVGIMVDVNGYGPHVGALCIEQNRYYGNPDSALQGAYEILEQWTLDNTSKEDIDELEAEHGEDWDWQQVLTETFDGWAFKLTPREFLRAIQGTDAAHLVDAYDPVRQALEKAVERLTDASAAQTWSTVGDREQSDAEQEGFDPESLVYVAEFGDAVGVNGDLELEKTEAGVSSDLEKEGYEMLDRGGRIPSTEEHVSAEHVIEAVAKETGLDEDVVAEAAKGLDWWPKDTRYEEIAWTTSGSAYLWGKKDKHAHVEDGDYVIQGSWSDGRISETFSMNDEGAAVDAAKKLLRDPTFEGDSVRVITRDGELVWDSKPEDEELEEARRRPSRGNRRR